MLPTKFRFIWPSGFREEDFFKSANQKQELPMVAMFVNESELMINLYREPSKDASYQVSVHLTKRLQRRRFF
jgi:flagellar basal body-associated protein FliL